MADIAPRRRIWGWWFFDWASQPFPTLLATFIFAPYVTDLVGDGSTAQQAWGFGIGAAGLVIAVLAPLLGTVADRSGRTMPFVWAFSAIYIAGSWGLWFARPGDYSLALMLLSFGVGLVGVEFATVFTNAMLPSLGTRAELGRISGTGWAFGYVGGLVALVLFLGFFAEGAGGRTLLGLAPAFGLDPGLREGTRAVGPFTAVWYAAFMVPFFLWVRTPRVPGGLSVAASLRHAVPDLAAMLRGLPRTPSLMWFLLASMLYRDALNGIYVFGGIYAKGVLGWSVVEVGTFGILALVTGAAFTWAGGRADTRWGPMPVIAVSLAAMTLVTLAVVFVSRGSVLGFPVAPRSSLPDVAFYAVGGVIGAAGGVLQSASRTMLVRQADPARMTETFGLYALSGKATAFVAPLSVAATTALTGSQPLGIAALIVLFLAGAILLLWVDPNGTSEVAWSAS